MTQLFFHKWGKKGLAGDEKMKCRLFTDVQNELRSYMKLRN